MAMTQANLDAIRSRYAHYGTPKPGTAHADVVALLAEVERQRAAVNIPEVAYCGCPLGATITAHHSDECVARKRAEAGVL